MTEQEQNHQSAKRFSLELFIVHPNIDPAEISLALRLDAHFSQRCGDQRRTPAGTPLPGLHQGTRWRHVVRNETEDHLFAAELTKFVESLVPHEAYFARLSQEGASMEVIVAFLGDGQYGDTIPRRTLARLDMLGLSLGIEVYSVPQR